MMDMANAPRRLKVMTAVGEWRDPACGMLPGCPAATRIMCLLLERWVAAGPPRLQPPGPHPVLGR